MKVLQLAVETTLFKKMSIDDGLRAIASCGFSHIEIGLSHFDAIGAGGDEIRRLGVSLRKHRLALAAVFALCDIASANPHERVEAVRRMKKAIRTTKKLGCELLVSELGGLAGERRKQVASFRRSVEELIPLLDAEDVTLSFEAHCGDFTERSDDAVALIRSFDSDRVKYLYCTPHTFTLGEHSRENILHARGLLNYLHVADTLKPERTFFSSKYSPKIAPHQHLIPGEGDVDFREIFSALKEASYDGFLVLDPFSHMDRPDFAAREARERVIELARESGLEISV